MDSTVVSVVMPVYNGERFLAEAVESILSQTLSTFEFIIVNDGSTDGTAAWLNGVSDRRVKVLTNETNKGIIFSLNKGIRESIGEFIARMDADDISFPDRLEQQVRFLRSHGTVAAVGGQTVLIDEKGNQTGEGKYPSNWESIKKSLFIHNPFAHGSVLLRREFLGSGDVYDPRFLHNEDYNLWLRLASAHQLENLPSVVLKRRVHGQNITVQKEKELVYYRRVTLQHAFETYYKRPHLKVHLLRPWLAYQILRMRNR